MRAAPGRSAAGAADPREGARMVPCQASGAAETIRDRTVLHIVKIHVLTWQFSLELVGEVS